MRTGIIDAIALLADQHRAVSQLFRQIEDAGDRAQAGAAFARLADQLVLHTRIEERAFYPAVYEGDSHPARLQAVEDHLSMKRLLAEMLKLPPDDHSFESKLQLLKEQVERHVQEEETQLFPEARKRLSRPRLQALAQRMMATASEREDDREREVSREDTAS